MSASDVLLHLKTNGGTGLSPAEAERRLEIHGPNRIGRTAVRSQLAILAEQMTSLPIMLLGGSAVVSAATGGVADAAVTLAVAGTNVVVGYATEGQAEKTLRDFAAPSSHSADVRRGGRSVSITGDRVAPGDIVLLTPGQFVAADGRVIESHHLTVDESALTGESVPVLKTSTALTSGNLALADRTNMVFMGTSVSGGSGEAVIVATGEATEIGRIQMMAGTTERPVTPVELELEALGRRLVYMAGAVCAAMFGIGVLRGYSRLAMLKNSIALAVAAVPEGLPTVATTTLALGLNEMKRKNALIRRLDAVESLGALQVVCFDKTGTLTQNTMTVRALHAGGQRIDAQRSERDKQPEPRELAPGLHAMLRTAVLCNEARNGVDDNGHAIGSATESALLALAADHGMDVDAVRSAYPLLSTAYRDGTRRRMTTIHRGLAADTYVMAMKGSPEEVLSLCSTMHDGTSIRPLTDAQRAEILATNVSLGAEGLRVLGFATRDFRGTDGFETEQDLTWLGLAGLADPIRHEAPELMKRFHAAGIRTVMITGDQATTAAAVARELKLSATSSPKVVTGTEVEGLPTKALSELARHADVFARVTPAHKLKIVQALQDAGFVVGMTGDGVNDGPALRAADIGVAMGLNGTDVAKDMANVVLSDDNLATLVDAIAQGRTIHANIRKALRFLLATNLSEIFITMGEALHGPNELETPLELLWINLATDVLPALGLAMLPPDADTMSEPPRPAKSPLLSNEDFRGIMIDGSIIGACTMGAHLYALARYGAGPQTRAITFSSIVMSQLLYAYTCRGPERIGAVTPPLFGSTPLNLAIAASVGVQALPLFVPAVQRLLGIAPLSWSDVPAVAISSVLPFLYREAAHRRRTAG